MLVLLPGLAFGVTFFFLNGRLDRRPREDSRKALIFTMLLFGATLTIVLEALSPATAIRQVPLALMWASVTALVVFLGIRAKAFPAGWGNLVRDLRAIGRGEGILIALLVGVALVLLVVAWISPVNNNDSMIYHMPRVLHWAQDASLRHYATMEHGQLTKPPWTEMSILNLRVLFGSDRPANLVQWSSMVLSLVGVSAIASLLGANGLGQAAAAAFAGSVPIGLLHATNTKNDYEVALWMVALAFLVVLDKRRPLRWGEVALVGVATGLGMLTKGTFFPYAFPMLLWLFLPRLRSHGIMRWLGQVALVGIVAAVLNAGFWARNIATYGGPYGGSTSALVTPSQLAPDQTGGGPSTTDGDGDGIWDLLARLGSLGGAIVQRIQEMALREIRLVAQNILIPQEAWRLQLLLARYPKLFAPDFVESLGQGMWNHEDTAGNLFHLLGFVGSAIIMIPVSLRRRTWTPIWYAGAAFAGFAGLALISYSVDLFGVRYQLPFFVLAAPVFGLALSYLGRPSLSIAAGVLLALSAIPYLLFNNTRPLVGSRPTTRSGSILETSAADLVFTHVPEQMQNYLTAAALIRDSSCRHVGLRASEKVQEYLIWWVLKAPQSGIRIEWLTAPPPLERFLDPTFEPCAVVCYGCDRTPAYPGLTNGVDLGSFQLFMRPVDLAGVGS